MGKCGALKFTIRNKGTSVTVDARYSVLFRIVNFRVFRIAKFIVNLQYGTQNKGTNVTADAGYSVLFCIANFRVFRIANFPCLDTN